MGKGGVRRRWRGGGEGRGSRASYDAMDRITKVRALEMCGVVGVIMIVEEHLILLEY